MPKIQILPPDVIAKIAAGEVVERPASVVKEIVENSIDAGATDITLKLKDAGKTLIYLKDNGSGIAKEDLENMFHRHATSKIKSGEDLFDIHSLGFRGEALYSIGSIADVTLRTKTNQPAWELHLRGGTRLDLKPSSLDKQGTEIEINELFFNTPARKKFLKTDSTEIAQILNVFIPYCLLHSNIRFKLTHQAKDLIDLTATTDPINRMADTLNVDAKHLMHHTQKYPGDLSIDCILGNINLKRTRRDLQFLFINGRPVQNKNLLFHVNQIYRLILAPDEFPVFMVNITMPAEELDVNIHPSKREVKLRNESSIASLLRELIERVLMSHGKMKEVTITKMPASQIGGSLSKISSGSLSEEVKIYQDDWSPKRFDAPLESTTKDYAFPLTGQSEEQQTFFIPELKTLAGDEQLHVKLENAMYAGVFLNKYLFFESGNTLLIVDQHAAQERIMYETFIKQITGHTVEIQNLLSPVLIKLSPQEQIIWDEVEDVVKNIGFNHTAWDNHTIAIHSHPAVIYDIERSVRNIISGEKFSATDHDTIARRACKASIRSGDKLNQQQAEHQIRQLLQCLDPFTCPHGRPTVIEMKESFLDKQFLRT